MTDVRQRKRVRNNLTRSDAIMVGWAVSQAVDDRINCKVRECRRYGKSASQCDLAISSSARRGERLMRRRDVVFPHQHVCMNELFPASMNS